MILLLSLVASELRKRAERANSTFSITDRTLVKKLNLGKRERMRVRYYIGKVPDAEIWRNSSSKTTFILKSDIVLRWCDFLAKRGVDLKSKPCMVCQSSLDKAPKSNRRLTRSERLVLEVIGKKRMVHFDEVHELNEISSNTINMVISSLRKKGLVKRIPDLTDMRRGYYALSEELASSLKARMEHLSFLRFNFQYESISDADS